MRVGFVLRSAEIKPLFFDLFCSDKHFKQHQRNALLSLERYFLLPPPPNTQKKQFNYSVFVLDVHPYTNQVLQSSVCGLVQTILHPVESPLALQGIKDCCYSKLLLLHSCLLQKQEDTKSVDTYNTAMVATQSKILGGPQCPDFF